MSLIFNRAKRIKYRRETFLQGSNRSAFRSFAVLRRIISGIIQKCGGCRLLRCNSADRRNGRICADSRRDIRRRNGDYRYLY